MKALVRHRFGGPGVVGKEPVEVHRLRREADRANRGEALADANYREARAALQRMLARLAQPERHMPLTKAVFAVVLCQRRWLPGFAAICGNLDLGNARVTAEGNAADGHRASR